MVTAIEKMHRFLWGAPMLLLILGVGIYLSIRTGFAQVTLFPRAIRQFFRKLLSRESSADAITPFQALCTALAATVGTGNLVGVAGAICLGGPGSIFWMWICGIFAMATKFAEATLAVHYRVRENGEYCGGPMYMIQNAMGRKFYPLAAAYSFLGVVAAFGVGNATQINAVIGGINDVLVTFGAEETRIGNLLLGALLAIAVGAMLLGGAKRIGTVAEKMVPIVSVLYILLSLGVLIARREALGAAFCAIIRGAFVPRAVTGGVIGSALRALSVGCSRGVFTNEAGMGTASIAHAGAVVDHPAQQGLMGIIEVFLDTIVICTLTALVILVSGVEIPYGTDVGGSLTTAAFTSVYGAWVSVFIAASLACFAFATVLGWGLYGARCAQFLFGSGAWKYFALLQTITVLISAMLNTELVWLLAETVNGLMAIPNLFALLALSGVLSKLTRELKEKSDL